MYKRMYQLLFTIIGTTTIFICTRECINVYFLLLVQPPFLYVQENVSTFIFYYWYNHHFYMHKRMYQRLFTIIGTTTIFICTRECINVYLLLLVQPPFLYVQENVSTFIYYHRYNHHFYMYKRMYQRLFTIIGTTAIFICTRECIHVYLLS